MPTNIDGLQSARTQIQDWVSLSEPRLSLFPPLESSGIVQTPKGEGGEKITGAVNQKSVLLQFHSDIHLLLCILLFLMPADCGWPCLAPEELVCCHVCTLTGSRVGSEGPKIFDQ